MKKNFFKDTMCLTNRQKQFSGPEWGSGGLFIFSLPRFLLSLLVSQVDFVSTKHTGASPINVKSISTITVVCVILYMPLLAVNSTTDVSNTPDIVSVNETKKTCFYITGYMFI